MMTRPIQLKWIFFFCLQAFESLFALVWLVSIPGEKTAANLFGLSNNRLLLAGIPIILLVLSMIGGMIFIFLRKLSLKFLSWLGDAKKRSGLGAICILMSIAIAVFVQISTLALGLNEATVLRLLPIECLLLLMFPQIGIVIQQKPIESKKLKIFNSLIPLCLSLGFIAMMVILGLWGGIQPVNDSPYYAGKGAPILPTQLFFILYIIIISLFIHIEFPEKTRWFKKLDLTICISLFLLTVWIWCSTPIPINNFTHLSNLISGELVPYSDSRIYDVNAQQMILGYGLSGGNSLPRPLYSFFLGLLHVIFGQSFSTIIQAQTIVLAFIPAGIYLLGKRLYNTTLGLSTAFFFILRETNQVLLSSKYTLSSVRMAMSEVLVAGFLVAFSIIAVIWLAKPESRSRSFITGVLLGLTALIRTQVLSLVFVILLFLILVLIKDRRKFIISSLIFFAGLLLVVFLWMGRNAIQSGKFVFEDLAYANRTILAIPDGNVSSIDKSGLLGTSVKYIRRTASLLTNNILSSLYQLPWDWNLHENLEEYVAGQIDQPFIGNQNLQKDQTTSLIIHLFLLGIGLAGAWHRRGLLGLLPAGIYLGYDLSSSGVGFSGWRFIQTVDWIIPLYWVIGVIECFSFLLFLNPWQGKDPSINSLKWLYPGGKKVVLMGALMAGFLLPVGELFFPLSTTSLDRSKLLSEMNRFNNSQKVQAVITLAMDPNTEINNGTLLYPQFIETRRDFWLNKLQDLISLDQPVLIFDVVTKQNNSYFLPLKDRPDFDLEDAPVIIVSCKKSMNNQAIALLVLKQDPFWLFTAQPVPDVCIY